MKTKIITVKRKSPKPYYGVAILWAAAAILFPLYKIWHFILLALASVLLFTIMKKICRDIEEQIEVEDKPKAAASGDKTVDMLITEGRARVEKIKSAAERTRAAHPNFAFRVDSIAVTAEKIFDYLEKSPTDLPRVRKFFTYYLPGLEKFVTTYTDMADAGIAGDNVNATMKSIEEAIATMDTSFVHLLDSLFDNEALDIETDITVLESMMAKEGIHEQDFKK
ncbi:MAG: 5-bromo-4-chloroindolyl phosphate hydrolysis family protein [Clostridia bacterium]|nr:5-bromo-4-chloroindolyl phosphate hydrolysis family protein [Clostridia bacterium]